MGGRRRDAGANPAGPGSIYQHVGDIGEFLATPLPALRRGPTVEDYPVNAGSTPASSMSRTASPTRAGRRISVIPLSEDQDTLA